jgi:hypothetical protein
MIEITGEFVELGGRGNSDYPREIPRPAEVRRAFGMTECRLFQSAESSKGRPT